MNPIIIVKSSDYKCKVYRYLAVNLTDSKGDHAILFGDLLGRPGIQDLLFSAIIPFFLAILRGDFLEGGSCEVVLPPRLIFEQI